MCAPCPVVLALLFAHIIIVFLLEQQERIEARSFEASVSQKKKKFPSFFLLFCLSFCVTFVSYSFLSKKRLKQEVRQKVSRKKKKFPSFFFLLFCPSFCVTFVLLLLVHLSLSDKTQTHETTSFTRIFHRRRGGGGGGGGGAGKLSHPLSYSLSDLSRRRERTHRSPEKEESSFSSKKKKKTKKTAKDEREYYDSIIKTMMIRNRKFSIVDAISHPFKTIAAKRKQKRATFF